MCLVHRPLIHKSKLGDWLQESRKRGYSRVSTNSTNKFVHWSAKPLIFFPLPGRLSTRRAGHSRKCVLARLGAAATPCGFRNRGPRAHRNCSRGRLDEPENGRSLLVINNLRHKRRFLDVRLRDSHNDCSQREIQAIFKENLLCRA